MKHKLTYSAIICVTLILLVLNVIPIIIFFKSCRLSVYSFPVFAVMAYVIINGVISYFFRHKGNFLMIRRYRSELFRDDQDVTFTDGYEREFRWMLLIYCIPIPFYLPIGFFASSWSHTLWTLLVFLLPQLIFLGYGIYETAQHVKSEKLRREQLENELKEQERREELGFWK